ncbi:MAG: transposase [Pseudobdellovibrionaceae bacterium]
MGSKQRSDDFCLFLNELHRRYHGKALTLLVDKDRSHEAAKSQKLATELGIHLIWLPTRSPELNAMESLWGFAKPRVCANRQYGTIENEVQKFIRFLHHLSQQKALQISGLRSENYWLFK